MEYTYRLAIITPYFGDWPYWIDLYMLSCVQNKEIDFYFFTDCGIPETAQGAANLHFISISFSDYCRQVSVRLGIDFQPANPYKICDLRPFFGYIHEDLLLEGGYDFWGYGDLDLVWGNIRAFCKDEILLKKDVFSTHADRVSGHFALIRNTAYYRNLCQSIPDWKMKLMDTTHYAMDEMDFSLLLYGKILRGYWTVHKVLLKMPLIDEWRCYSGFVKFANRLFCPHQLYFVEQHTTPYPNAVSKKEVNFTYDGKSLRDMIVDEERMYLHFLCLKEHWSKDCYAVTNGFNKVVFTADGIFSE